MLTSMTYLAFSFAAAARAALDVPGFFDADARVWNMEEADLGGGFVGFGLGTIVSPLTFDNDALLLSGDMGFSRLRFAESARGGFETTVVDDF